MHTLLKFLLSLSVAALLVIAGGHARVSLGHADGSGSGSSSAAHVDAPPPAVGNVGLAPPAPLPATIHDPLESPAPALDDARALKTHGWAAMAFGVLLMVTKALAYIQTALQNVPVLGAVARWLSVGRRAVYLAGAGAIAAAGYNAVLLGGSWVAALWAAGLALGTAVNPLSPAK